MATEDDPLSDDVLHLLVENQNRDDTALQKEKELQKTVSPVQSTNATASPTIRGMDENMAKILARRSQGVTITEDDLFMGHANADDEVAIDFGADAEEGVPGAYSGAPGADYGRVQKTPLPQYLLGDATQISQDNDKSSESDDPSNDPQWTFQGVDEESERRKKKRRIIVFISIGTLLLLLAVILPTVLLLGDEEPKQDPGEEVANPAAPSTETMLISNLNLTQYTLDALEDPDSYQFWAYGWVKKDPLWGSIKPWRKQQRFALACVFYALQINVYEDHERWGAMQTIRAFQRHVDECLWQSDLESRGCDESGRIRTLDLTLAIKLKGWLPREIAFLAHLNTIISSGVTIDWDLETFLPLNMPNGLPALKTLNLSDCALSGSIPSTLGLLTTLTRLDLSRNALTSTIPSQLGQLSRLSVLVLSRNNLSGTVPEELGELPSLVELHFDNNTSLESITP